jgi:hypothetical protein
MWQTAVAIVVSKPDREFMEELVRSGNTPQKVIFRIGVVLGAADGISNAQLVRNLGTTKSSGGGHMIEMIQQALKAPKDEVHRPPDCVRPPHLGPLPPHIAAAQHGTVSGRAREQATGKSK